jgi:fatty acid desaturase
MTALLAVKQAVSYLRALWAARRNLRQFDSYGLQRDLLPIVPAMERRPPPFRVNLVLTAAAFAVALFQFVVVPVFLLPETDVMSVAAADVAALAIAILLSLGTPFIRALLHEAIHGRLARSTVWNVRIGRALAICSGISFDAIRLGHMVHHRFPRHSLDRADVIAPGKNRLAGAVEFYCGLLGWIYVRETLSSMIMLLPRRAIMWVADRAMPSDEAVNVSLQGALRRGLDRRLQRIRVDSIFVILVYAGAFYLYGDWWPVLLTAIALRGLVVSLQDNVAHYDTPAEIGAPAHNSRTARWAGLFMLNSNLHGVHHDRPDIAWNRLPDAFRRADGSYSGGYFSLLLKQFYGPQTPGANEHRAS